MRPHYLISLVLIAAVLAALGLYLSRRAKAPGLEGAETAIPSVGGIPETGASPQQGEVQFESLESWRTEGSTERLQIRAVPVEPSGPSPMEGIFDLYPDWQNAPKPFGPNDSGWLQDAIDKEQ